MAENVVLIGFSGTGKSAVGRRLADRLGWPFVDSDQVIVERFGKSIARIFREEGEAVFRAAEREVVARLCAGRRQVIALGGGAVVDPANRAWIRRGNRVVCLEARPETILTRLTAQPTVEVRPLLAGPDPLARIIGLKAERAPFYAIADVTIDTEGLTPDQVVERILAWLKQVGPPTGESDEPSADPARRAG